MFECFVKAGDFLDFPINVQVIYRDVSHPFNNFKDLYHSHTDIYIHKDLMVIVLKAALDVYHKYGYKIQIDDSLRTVDAQIKMEKFALANNWNEDLISRPGTGMHPKGLAVDIELIGNDGKLIDMGAHFDEFSVFSDKFHNKAHRYYVGLSDIHKERRKILDDAMLKAADKMKIDLLLLESEWWDFRFREDIYSIKPIYDKDLPRKMRQMKENLSLDEVEYNDNLYQDSLKYVRNHVHT